TLSVVRRYPLTDQPNGPASPRPRAPCPPSPTRALPVPEPHPRAPCPRGSPNLREVGRWSPKIHPTSGKEGFQTPRSALLQGNWELKEARFGPGTGMVARRTGYRPGMTRYGYTLLCEQAPPDQLVADAVRAEESGFDFAVVSDHYYPWLTEQGHS